MSLPAAQRLDRGFYARPTLDVCADILGKYIVHEGGTERLAARIVEVEAYIGKDDPACHASAGKTARTALMFGEPGHAYIYLIYGMYYCLNFVTEPKGDPAAVLLRAAEPVEGIAEMRATAPKLSDTQLLAGPGKLCRAFRLTLEQNGWDLTDSRLYLEDRGERPKRIARSPRIGISKATERKWRFCDPDSLSVSKRPAGRIRNGAASARDSR